MVDRTRENIDRIAELLRDGFTVRKIASEFEADYFVIYRLIVREGISMPPKSGRSISPEKRERARELLLESNMGVAEIAKALGLKSRSSIYALREKLHRAEERKAEKERSFHETKTKSRLCSVHGPVTVWPCVACEAERYRQQTKPNQLHLAGNSR